MSRPTILKGLLTAFCVIGFAVITYFITQGVALPLDTAIQNAVFSWRNDLLTPLLTLLTYSGNWQTVSAICVVLLALPTTRSHYGVPLTVSAVLSVTLYEALKFIFQRPRPDAVLHLIHQGGFSFPSGHTLTALVFWGTAILLLRMYSHVPHSLFEEAYDFPHITKKTAVSVLTAVLSLYIFLMGFSRIYLGVHFPTDVLGSWCLGACILLALSSYYLPSLRLFPSAN